MIRIILFSAAFLGVSAALIIFQPGAMQIRDRFSDTPDTGLVTRAAATPDSLPRANASPAPADGGNVNDVLAALVREAQQKPIVVDTNNPAAAIAAAVNASRGAESDDLARTTESILRELGRTPSAAEGDALMAMTQNVLSSLSGNTTADARSSGDLKSLVVQALRQGQSDAYLDALLNEARDTGQVVVPEALITSDGKVDTATLLATLVRRSVNTGGTGPVGSAAASGSDTTRPRARPNGQSEIYTVQPGDSLAAISFRYYGDTLQYTVIFEANRDKITTPDKIRVGQKLTIPVL